MDWKMNWTASHDQRRRTETKPLEFSPAVSIGKAGVKSRIQGGNTTWRRSKRCRRLCVLWTLYHGGSKLQSVYFHCGKQMNNGFWSYDWAQGTKECQLCFWYINEDQIKEYIVPQEASKHKQTISSGVPQEQFGLRRHTEREREWERESTMDLSRLFPMVWSQWGDGGKWSRWRVTKENKNKQPEAAKEPAGARSAERWVFGVSDDVEVTAEGLKSVLNIPLNNDF